MSRETLLQEIEDVLGVYEREIGVTASRTRQMIGRYGPVEALSRLAVSAELQSGFRVLRDLGRLEMTFETVIVRYADFFRGEVVKAARWRLENAHLLE